MDKIRVRFAPSPTGFLHVGNARTALFNWLFARQQGGVFILRIEDTDVERSAAEYERSLIHDLRWLELDWDEGPDIGGDFGPYRQSERLEIYEEFTQRLLEKGKAYYCFCSPEELEKERERALATGRMPIYGGKCRSLTLKKARKRLDAGEQAAVRLLTPYEGSIGYDDLVRGHLTFELQLIGDPVLVRSNRLPSYNYAVVIDDFLMKVTHVIRGEDHISNTPRQLLIYRSLSIPAPQFAHLSMVMGRDNTRLSKRHGATAVDQFEKLGILPTALFNYLSMLGWAPPEGREILDKDELVQLFDLTKVSRSSAIFDHDKLNWLNRQHIKELSARQKAKIAYPFLREAKLLPDKMSPLQWKWLENAVESLSERVDKFSDFPQEFAVFFEFSLLDMKEEIREELKTDCARKVIKLFWDKLKTSKEFDYDKFTAFTQEIRNETGCRGKNLFHPLRIALTAKGSGLELDKFIPLVEEGSKLGFPLPVKGCSQRIEEVMGFL